MKGYLTILLALALFAAILPGCARKVDVYYSSPDHGIHGDEIE
jgi:hypothetical protein